VGASPTDVLTNNKWDDKEKKLDKVQNNDKKDDKEQQQKG
jgi:hypothetical protein